MKNSFIGNLKGTKLGQFFISTIQFVHNTTGLLLKNEVGDEYVDLDVSSVGVRGATGTGAVRLSIESADLPDDITFFLPEEDGAAGDLIKTDGSRRLSFVAPPTGFTTEQIQDLVAAMFAGTHTKITVTYDDPGGTITLAVSGLDTSDISGLTEFIQDAIGSGFVTGTSPIEVTYNDGSNTFDVHLNTAAITELVQDIVGAFITSATADLTAVYNDALNTFTLTLSGLTASDITDFNSAVDARIAASTDSGVNFQLETITTAVVIPTGYQGIWANAVYLGTGGSISGPGTLYVLE